MKKLISLFLCLALLAGTFAGCGNIGKSKSFTIVATTFPIYDWVRQVLGEEMENVDLILLQDNGADLHNYQPTADDIVTIASCDMFVYVGGHSDEWVDEVLAQSINENMVVINLCQVLGDAVKEEEAVEGMEHEHEEEHEGHVHEDDEHIWLSLRNAKAICREIGEKLSVMDSENAETYKANAQSYCDKLDTLDEAYQGVVEAATTKTLLFGDRFPFRYLTDDYGLTYYAAFSGCSAESEASFETIAFLAEKMDALDLQYIMIIEGSDGSIAKTVVNATAAKNAKVLTLDSMQTITADDVKQGATYLSIMERNLAVLEEALS